MCNLCANWFFVSLHLINVHFANICTARCDKEESTRDGSENVPDDSQPVAPGEVDKLICALLDVSHQVLCDLPGVCLCVVRVPHGATAPRSKGSRLEQS